ncbi:MAG: hypothetical protein IKA79_02360 [Lentisphaeria bacterium]|nr:hypothetical protein [Lentisphaeria bacterium]
MKKSNFLYSAILCAALFTVPHFVNASEEEKGPGHECTSWMVFSDLTKNNTNFLHKNRDATSRNIAVLMGKEEIAVVEKNFWENLITFWSEETKTVKRKWVGLGNSSAEGTHISVCMGMNASGLACVMNSGETCVENNDDKTKKGTPAILKAILESCDTAKEAIAKLDEFLKAKDYFHKKKGSIFFFMDTKEGYVCEITAKFNSPQKYDNGYAVRANIWYNPGMMQRSISPIQSYIGSSVRAFVAYTTLNKALQKNGRITVSDSLALARTHVAPEKSPNPRSVCFKYTNSSSTLVIDKEFPGVLSTGYHTIGHPRHGICVPVPICVETLDKRMTDLSWSKFVWARFDKKGLEAPIPEAWLAFEKKSFAEYESTLEKARTLLREDKKAEAVKLLNDKAAAIWKEAAKIMGI